MLSPGYSYEKAPDQQHFLGRARTRRLFRAILSNREKDWRFRTWAGYWILPHPAQARLQRNRGSSISTSGYCFRRASF